jgi:hypothetical protein
MRFICCIGATGRTQNNDRLMKRVLLSRRSSTETVTAVFVLLSAFFSLGALFLSLLGQVNRAGCSVLLVAGGVGSIFAYHRLNGGRWATCGVRLRRFKKPFPALYLLCALAAIIGGAIHPPTNHDALSYRVPRLLHWLAEGHWHWIGSTDTRMDFTGVGFEVLMLPSFAALHSLRFLFLINAIPYLLMPGLVFSVFTSLGIKKSIAALWMWILPCASCYAIQAGSIGNDFIACIYLLAALSFASRAASSGSKVAVLFAVLSAALMTGVKATNLPLLLPIAICLIPVFVRFPKTLVTAAGIGCIAIFTSFVPIAVVNTIHTGDWTGNPDSPLMIGNPAVGLAGNSILVGSAALAPPVFPAAEKINSWFNSKTEDPFLRWIKVGFPTFRMTHPQLATEEHSGFGLGVTGALLLGLAGAWHSIRFGRLHCHGGWVFAGFWIALMFFMMKLGNSAAPRYLAPYYPGMIGFFLLTLGSAKVFKKRWWRWGSLALLLPILPALACNPARPLLPMRSITTALTETGVGGRTAERMQTVYAVYANRHDVYAPVRAMLPPDAKSIAFAGTSGDSEYSFWLPLGTTQVSDFVMRRDGGIPDPSKYDAIVASTLGTGDRFGISPQELAKRIGWKIIGTTEIRSLAASEAAAWSVLVPDPDANHKK